MEFQFLKKDPYWSQPEGVEYVTFKHNIILSDKLDISNPVAVEWDVIKIFTI